MKTTNFIEISNRNKSLSFGQCKQFYESVEYYLKKYPNYQNSEKILEQADSVLVKFLTTGINLEFLWQIKYAKPQNEFASLLTEKEWENSLSFTDYVFFDNFIHQSVSYLDHLKGLVLLTLGIKRKWRNNKDFFDLLSKVEDYKGSLLYKLFENIYEKGKWGDELNTIRNKISHNQIFKTDSKYIPTISNKEYQRFCQDVENNMFLLLINIQEKLFDTEWISGKH